MKFRSFQTALALKNIYLDCTDNSGGHPRDLNTRARLSANSPLVPLLLTTNIPRRFCHARIYVRKSFHFSCIHSDDDGRRNAVLLYETKRFCLTVNQTKLMFQYDFRAGNISGFITDTQTIKMYLFFFRPECVHV